MTITSLTPPDLPPVVRDAVDGLAALKTVRSIRIAGSRARGRPTSPASDWDVLVYVEDPPAPEELHRLLPADAGPQEAVELVTANLGHPFQESEYTIPVSPRIDVCFRPLAHVRREETLAAQGAFTVYSYPKIASGVPSYILLSEAALSAPVHGDVGSPARPTELALSAGPWWRGRASCALLLAIDHVTAGEKLGALEHVLAAATSLAHSRLIARAQWYPITKRLLNEPGALDDRARQSLNQLSADRLSPDVVYQVAEDLGLDPEDGLDWLARGEHIRPGGPDTHPTQTGQR
ncbi:nucleotidyltransferase family protein [Streptomyces sp. NPDC056670]|uniref:nucleotidyltransferase family protein n=1 Tax=Streptomyces sp. NPDC056670 TaxID=3345904 RepID=UPI0036807CB2